MAFSSRRAPRLLCRPVIMHRLDRTMTMYTENGLITMITTDSPRLTVTLGEWYGSDVFTQTRHDLRHTCDISAAADCNAVIRNELIFRRLNLPNEFSAGRNGDYIWLNSGTGLSVCAIPVTGSLHFGHPRGLLSLHCFESVPRTQNCHCQTTVVRITPDICYSHPASSIIVVLLIWYCSGVFRIRAMASDGLSNREQAGPSGAPSGPLPGTFLGHALDVRSENLYELGPDIPDVMGLRAFRPDAAAVKIMSVRDSRCIRVVTPDDHVRVVTTRYCYMIWEKRICHSCHSVSWTISVVPGRGLYLHL